MISSIKQDLFDDTDSLAQTAAQYIYELSLKSIKDNGCFNIVLAGGSSPLATYKILAKFDIDWSKWNVFFGDERCLAFDDKDRNHQMILQTGLLDNIKQVFVIPSDNDLDDVAEIYAHTLLSYRPFDLVILGMGPDGHTASLFPQGDWNENTDDVLVINNSPKPPKQRITLNKHVLQDTHQLLALISGQDKRLVYQQWLKGELFPIAEVMSQGGDIMIEESLVI